jgi:hypothetical protein
MSEGRTIEMKMAKASDEDINTLTRFMEWLEEFSEAGIDIHKPLIDEQGEEFFPCIDDDAAMEKIREEFSRWTRRATVAGSWRRVVWGFQILRDNCCDPAANVLEWNPELKALIEAADSPALEPHPFTADAWQLQETANA